MPRIHSPAPLHEGLVLELEPTAARHVQVLRMQPGDGLTLFDGRGGEWDASVEHMGRSNVRVRIGAHHTVEREAPLQVHLAIGVPANDRMDWLVEKAAELGAASVQPLLTERAVLRLEGERARRRQEHWQAVAVAACEQCGRNRVPLVHAPVDLARWQPPAGLARAVLSLDDDAAPLHALPRSQGWLLVSGPEGGLNPKEVQALRAAGFLPLSLGPRVLRADTAPIATLAALTLGAPA
jgi:16S rRNA (uracil1498-N3)-methyltransferase